MIDIPHPDGNCYLIKETEVLIDVILNVLSRNMGAKRGVVKLAEGDLLSA